VYACPDRRVLFLTDRWSLSTDEQGVSPVIAVILLVAITVILAAVISVFVLGLAEDTNSAAPQAGFSIMENGTDVIVTHTGGAKIDGDRLRFAGAATEYTTVGSIDEWRGSTVSAGNSAVVSANPGTVYLLWDAPNSEESAMLAHKDVAVPSVTVTKIDASMAIRGGDAFRDGTIDVSIGAVENVPNDEVYVTADRGFNSRVISSGETKTLSTPRDLFDYQKITLTIRTRRGGDILFRDTFQASDGTFTP